MSNPHADMGAYHHFLGFLPFIIIAASVVKIRWKSLHLWQGCAPSKRDCPFMQNADPHVDVDLQ